MCTFKLPSSKPYFVFKAILEGYGIDASKIKIFEIENEPEMQAIQNHMGKITGGSTVPRIFIGGKFVGGCDEVNFSLFFWFLNNKILKKTKKKIKTLFFFQVTKLHSSGKLREMLSAVGAC